ncbi:MAG: Crp/Fnr family transcriptional regulator [Chitinophagaceae bacterium]|nr:Crp/Fnr family transcriptional regulator [Chitinophagaceae bacterium]
MTEEQLLLNFIKQLHPLTDEEANAFISGWKPVTLKRKTLMTAAGERERYLYFVLEGVQRAFYLTSEGREATIVFTYPPSFSGVADSLLTATPSEYFMETLTASRFLRIPAEEMFRLTKLYPTIQQMVLNTTAMILKGVLYRQIELQCFTNEEKFRALMKRSPHILNLVPHKYIASYLGMDATNFSKLLGSVRI